MTITAAMAVQTKFAYTQDRDKHTANTVVVFSRVLSALDIVN